MKKITIIGGGTGTFVVTRGLKSLNFDLTKIVTVFDSGGSTARLRDEFGFLPIGDLRQSLAALAQENSKSWIRDLLLYRFSKGVGLEGHNLGNLILIALQDMTGSTPKALEVASKIFRLKGLVLPITTDQADLKVTYEDNTFIVGEHLLDDMDQGGKKIIKLETTSDCKIYQSAMKAILNADFIIIGPGDLYASILPNFIVSGTKQALKQTKAKLIYIVNLMTRYTQTHNYTASQHINIVEDYLGTNLDYVIINSGKIKPSIVKKYATHKEFPVKDDLPTSSHFKIIRGDFASSVEVKKNPSDPVPRALMRHDQNKITKALLKIIK